MPRDWGSWAGFLGCLSSDCQLLCLPGCGLLPAPSRTMSSGRSGRRQAAASALCFPSLWVTMSHSGISIIKWFMFTPHASKGTQRSLLLGSGLLSYLWSGGYGEATADPSRNGRRREGDVLRAWLVYLASYHIGQTSKWKLSCAFYCRSCTLNRKSFHPPWTSEVCSRNSPHSHSGLERILVGH